ncbi:MAG: crossover junction endodeoxyribonuclease RuvC [Ignavibacteria bacterium]|nr:crossover junction endodeoxyribonuclease RuvC [Ignavibacteria bacterium]
MYVIGIDPGSVRCGFAVLKNELFNGKLIVVDLGLVKPNAKVFDFLNRIKILYDKFSEVFEYYRIEETAIESQFYHKNVQTLMKLTQAKTAIELVSLNKGIPIYEYSPREIKLSVTGTGASSKNSVKYMLEKILNINLKSEANDVTDALATAVCHLIKKTNPLPHNNKSLSWEAFIKKHPEKVLESFYSK